MFESLLYGLLILYIVHEARVMLLLRHFCKVSPCSHSHWHCLVLPYLFYRRNCMVNRLVHLASLLCQASLLIKHDRSTEFLSIVVIVSIIYCIPIVDGRVLHRYLFTKHCHTCWFSEFFLTWNLAKYDLIFLRWWVRCDWWRRLPYEVSMKISMPTYLVYFLPKGKCWDVSSFGFNWKPSSEGWKRICPWTNRVHECFLSLILFDLASACEYCRLWSTVD